MEHVSVKDDSGLVERCILGDASAWDSLIGRYTPLIKDAIYNRARKYGVSLPRHEIEDVMQEVLTSIWSGGKLSAVKNRKDISCWLAIVSGNAAVQYLRDRDDAEPLDEEKAEAVSAEEAQGEEVITEIKTAVEKLPPKERLIIELHLFHDKKYREIADMLDLPEGTVSSYIKRSKARLKKKLKYLQ